ncbi:unnamed protein product [Pleuronectes platessa]|uniref:Uncharacterized protein n=1 Tax=Pleuronectes platessa TaxID=8262 RepID=A0A9N7V3L6_PLEPL|nr:unnamed protein product [Pleuronectes platessa]
MAPVWECPDVGWQLGNRTERTSTAVPTRCLLPLFAPPLTCKQLESPGVVMKQRRGAKKVLLECEARPAGEPHQKGMNHEKRLSNRIAGHRLSTSYGLSGAAADSDWTKNDRYVTPPAARHSQHGGRGHAKARS